MATKAKSKSQKQQAKPQKRAKARVKGIDTVFTLIARNMHAKEETVLKKARKLGVKTSATQLGRLYYIGHKQIEALTACGKL